MAGKAVSWTSSNTSIATVDANGTVSVVARGTVSITATVDGKSGTAQVTGLMPVADIAITPDSLVLSAGDTVSLRATLKDRDGVLLTGRAVTWTSGATTVATVNAAGMLSAIGAGQTLITATAEGASASVRAIVGRTESQLPQVSCTDCIEVVPAGAFLPGQGAQQLLQAFRVDGQGRRSPVQPTWRSSRPGNASVSAGGLVTAATSMGSAQITASVAGLVSEPVVIVIATPQQGIVLVRDAEVDGEPGAVDSTMPLGPGWKTRLRLRGRVPAVGQVLMGTEQTAVGGRVTAVRSVGTDVSEVDLELVPLGAFVTGVQVDESIPITLGEVSVDGDSTEITPRRPVEPSRPWRTPVARVTLDPNEPFTFAIGKFECTASESIAGLTLGVKATVSARNARLDVAMSGVWPQRFRVLADVGIDGHFEAKLAAGVNAKLTCRRRLKSVHPPLPMPLRLLLTGDVEMGVGFAGSLDVPAIRFGIDASVRGTTPVAVGLVCRDGPCTEGGAVDVSQFAPSATVAIQNIAANTRADATVQGFGYVELGVVDALKKGYYKFKVAEARAGLELSASLADIEAQRVDPLYASNVQLSPYGELKAGRDLQALGKLLSVTVIEGSLKLSVLPLARTPSGTFTVTPSVAAGSQQTLGEVATFEIALNPVTFLTSYAVDEVSIYWYKVDATGRRRLQAGPPGCATIRPTSAQQTTFKCQARFVEADSGRQDFYAFVKPKLLGVPLPVDLEIDHNAVATVDVRNVQVEVQPRPAVISAGASQLFKATVTGANDTSVTWTATGGSISNTGLYTAGNVGGTSQVKASSNARPDKVDVVTFTVVAATSPTISLSASTATFTATVGGPNPPSQNSIQVTNGGSGLLNGLGVGTITYQSGQPTGWLSASLSSATAPASVTLAAVTGALSPGTYTAFVPITSSASLVTNTPRTITVSFTVSATATPTINLSASTANFAATAGGASPPSQNSIQVTNSGTGTLSGLGVGTITYQAGKPTGWLSASLSSATAPSTVTISAATGFLPAGTYTALVPIVSTAPQVTNSPRTITVTFSLASSGASPRLYPSAYDGTAWTIDNCVALLGSTVRSYEVYWNGVLQGTAGTLPPPDACTSLQPVPTALFDQARSEAGNPPTLYWRIQLYDGPLVLGNPTGSLLGHAGMYWDGTRWYAER